MQSLDKRKSIFNSNRGLYKTNGPRNEHSVNVTSIHENFMYNPIFTNLDLNLYYVFPTLPPIYATRNWGNNTFLTYPSSSFLLSYPSSQPQQPVSLHQSTYIQSVTYPIAEVKAENSHASLTAPHWPHHSCKPTPRPAQNRP